MIYSVPCQSGRSCFHDMEIYPPNGAGAEVNFAHGDLLPGGWGMRKTGTSFLGPPVPGFPGDGQLLG